MGEEKRKDDQAPEQAPDSTPETNVGGVENHPAEQPRNEQNAEANAGELDVQAGAGVAYDASKPEWSKSVQGEEPPAELADTFNVVE